MKTLIQVVLARRLAQAKYFKNYPAWSRKIKNEAKDLLGPNRVFIFGSVLQSERTGWPAEDIDILIVSSRLDSVDHKREIRTKIWQKVGINSPFELHLTTPDQYENWYRSIIGPDAKEVY